MMSPFLRAKVLRKKIFVILHVSSIVVLIIVLAGSTSITGALALEGEGVFSTGFDSNPSLEPDRKESFFAVYRLELHQPFFLPGFLEGGFNAEGYYRQYLRVGDNYRGATSISISRSFLQERCIPSAFIQAGLYRDELVREDERNGASVKFGVDYIINAYVTFGLSYKWTWLDYLHHTEPLGGRPGQGPPGGMPSRSYLSAVDYPGSHSQPNMRAISAHDTSHPGGNPFPEGGGFGPGGRFSYVRRDDRLHMASCFLNFQPKKFLALEATVNFGHLFSEVPVEDYKFAEVVIGATFSGPHEITTSLTGSYIKYRYKTAPRGIKRRDYGRRLSCMLSRTFDRMEPFIAVHWEELDSPLHSESYKRVLGQCGISVSF